MRILFNGTTLHGSQFYGPNQERMITSYYHPDGPLGQAMRALPELSDPQTPMAFIGLGAGTVACYGKPGQKVTFFEIDPAVYDIAKNPQYFSYLTKCDPRIETRLVDGRLGLLHDTEHYYGIIVVDAFSSDAIPVHLITNEAIQLMMNRLGEHGVAMFHISNRYYNLEPVLARIVEENSLFAMIQGFSPAGNQWQTANASEWVAIAKSPTAISHLITTQHGQTCPEGAMFSNCWRELRTNPRVGLWTDRFSSPISALYQITQPDDYE